MYGGTWAKLVDRTTHPCPSTGRNGWAERAFVCLVVVLVVLTAGDALAREAGGSTPNEPIHLSWETRLTVSWILSAAHAFLFVYFLLMFRTNCVRWRRKNKHETTIDKTG